MKEKLKKIKTLLRGRGLLVCAGVLGLVLLLAGSFGSGCNTEMSGVQEETSLDAYRAALTKEAEALCRRVTGAGDTYIMLTLESGESMTYSGSHVTSVTPPRVLGVAVVSEGARSDTVRAELTELLGALFHVGAHRIHISPAK